MTLFKKSIFSQLFFYTTIAILFGFIVMGVLMYGLLGNYLSASKEGELFAIAESWADFTEKLALRTNTYERENYQMYIDALSHSTDTSVVVLNTDGRVMAATSNNTNFSIKREFYEDVMHGLLQPDHRTDG